MGNEQLGIRVGVNIVQGLKEAEKQINTFIKGYSGKKIAMPIDTAGIVDFNKQLKEIQQNFASKYWQGRFQETTKGLTASNSQLEKMKQYYSQLEKSSASLALNQKKNDQKYWQGQFGDSVKNLTASNTELQKMKQYYSDLEKSSAKLVSVEERKAIQFKNQSNQLQQLQNTMAKIGSLKDNQGVFKNKPELLAEYNKLNSELKTMDVTSEKWANGNYGQRVKDLQSGIKVTSNEMDTFTTRLGKNISKFAEWFAVGGLVAGLTRSIKLGVESVIKLDSAVTDLNKVLDLNDSQTNRFINNAREIGNELARTATEVTNAAAVFGQAGYGVEDSTELAKQALLLTNIADGIDDVSTASSYLIAVISAYNLKVSDTANIVDILNEVSNRYAVDTNNLADGLQRAAGTLAMTGTSMNELTGLLTAGYTQLRNMEKVSTGLITISSRLRGEYAPYVQKCA